jgi:hypothetical protein
VNVGGPNRNSKRASGLSILVLSPGPRMDLRHSFRARSLYGARGREWPCAIRSGRGLCSCMEPGAENGLAPFVPGEVSILV